MKVFNLTNKTLDYRGRHIGPYGSVEIPEITFIPNRDRLLADRGMLAFGSLPAGWVKPKPPPVPEPVQDTIPVADAARVKLVTPKVVNATPAPTPAPVLVDPVKDAPAKDAPKSKK